MRPAETGSINVLNQTLTVKEAEELFYTLGRRLGLNYEYRSEPDDLTVAAPSRVHPTHELFSERMALAWQHNSVTICPSRLHAID